jgi:hypothetical protein
VAFSVLAADEPPERRDVWPSLCNIAAPSQNPVIEVVIF